MSADCSIIEIKNFYKVKPSSKTANCLDPNLPQQYKDQVIYVRAIFDRGEVTSYTRVDEFIFKNTISLYMYMVFLYNLSEEDLVHLTLLGIELVADNRETFKALVNDGGITMRGLFLG